MGLIPVAVVIGALAIPPLWGDRTLIRQVVVEGADVRGLDAAGRTRWTYRLAHTATSVPRRGRPYQILDLDGDGQDEVLAVVATAQSPVREVVDELYCFSQDGLLRWTWTSKVRLQFRDAEYGPPWSHMDMVPYTADGRPRLAIALRHYTWWPSMVVLLDPAANERVAFVSSGWMGHVGVAPDGRSLLVTGISNEHGQYFLSVVDPEKPARSPERDGVPGTGGRRSASRRADEGASGNQKSPPIVR